MSFNARRVTTAASAGNLDTLVAGTSTAMAKINMNQVEPGSLAARAVVDAETTSITMTGKWQVSIDDSTYIDVANGSQNAAGVALATGTAGADASVDRVYPAPDAVYSFPYARFAIVNAGATGAAVDTYSVTYHYMKPKFAG